MITVQGVSDHSGNAMPSAVQTSTAVLGDHLAPSFANAFVNRRADGSGKTIDVLFSEDVNQAFASNALQWSATGGPNVLSVTMLEKNHARIVLSSALGAAQTIHLTGVPDLAQNASGAIAIDPAE